VVSPVVERERGQLVCAGACAFANALCFVLKRGVHVSVSPVRMHVCACVFTRGKCVCVERAIREGM
jgi:hypothetical protein